MADNANYENPGTESRYKSIVERIRAAETYANTAENIEVRIDMSGMIGGTPGTAKRPSYSDTLRYIDSKFKGAVVSRPVRTEVIYEGGAQEAPARQKVKKININMGELVLPTLSVADQISELERITIAISEQVLDERHMQVIAEEAYGLKRAVETSSDVSGMDSAMRTLRDRRLSEVISKIDMEGV